MKAVYISIVVAVAMIGGVLLLGGRTSTAVGTSNQNNVTVVDGQQIVEIRAKGGYHPRKSVAKAGIPTTLRFETNGTFDCSSSIRIPSLNITRNLPQSGNVDLDLDSQPVSVLKGSCGMGMYPFEIEFTS